PCRAVQPEPGPHLRLTPFPRLIRLRSHRLSGHRVTPARERFSLNACNSSFETNRHQEIARRQTLAGIASKHTTKKQDRGGGWRSDWESIRNRRRPGG